MPTYQYRCTECGQDLEAVQKFSDPALTECPNCRGKLRKVFNAVGVVFKGSGFYRTDSRKPDTGGGPSAPSPSGETKTESGGSDSKPAKEKVAASTSSSTNGSSGSSGSNSSSSGSSGSSGSSSTGSTSS